jgi:nucleotidyltransferase substrate binding protein (TIGR01987 family)
MILDRSALENAIVRGEEALAFCASDLAKNDPRLALHLRAGAIQAFEFTYELAIRTLRRHLVETEPDPSAVMEMTFNALIRRGYELGLLRAEVALWQDFRRRRGTTSHTYDSAKAQAVFEIIPEFLAEARFLLVWLAVRQASAT